MSKTIYITGKVSDLPEEQWREKFDRAAEGSRSSGHRVLYPASIGPEGDDHETVLRNRIKMMLGCDEVHFLPCWQECRGAQLERDIAVRLGMTVVYH